MAYLCPSRTFSSSALVQLLSDWSEFELLAKVRFQNHLMVVFRQTLEERELAKSFFGTEAENE